MSDQHEHFQLSQKIVLYSKNNQKFLLLKDAEPESEYVQKYGLWDLPGGRLEKGEEIQAALIREIREEIGDIPYELHDVVYATTMSIPQDEPEDPHRVKVFYLATTESDAIQISDEHTEHAWMTFEEIEKNTDCKEWLKNAVAAAIRTVKTNEGANDALRILADFENYKKRQAAEAKEFSTHLAKSLVSDLIPVLTNLQAASDHVPADAKESPWVMGITYIEKQFEDALKNYGVVPIEVKPGDTFNPLEHEAVDQKTEAGKDSEHKIEKVVQKGYKMGERVIKAARVIVS